MYTLLTPTYRPGGGPGKVGCQAVPVTTPFARTKQSLFQIFFFSTTTKNPRLCCGNECQPRRSRMQIYCSYPPGSLIMGGGVLSRTQTLGRSCEASRSRCSEATCGTRGQTLCFCYCKAVFTPQRRFFTPEAVVI